MASDDLSDTLAIKLTRFFMRFAGFWIWNDRRGKLLMVIATIYTVFAIVLAWIITAVDFWYSRRDFNQVAYAAGNSMTIFIILMKLTIFLINREAFLDLIKYCYTNFWQREYDSFGKSVLRDCTTRCTYFVCTFTVLAQSVVGSYTMQPIIANIGQNDTDRILPLAIYLDLPLSTTPYYEITFFIEVMSMYHSGICYFSFDNMLCIMLVHVTGQFRILQRQLESVYDGNRYNEDGYRSSTLNRDSDSKYLTSASNSGDQYEKFRACVKYHQSLIHFIEMVENVYTFVILGQVIIFSLLISLVSYQAVLAEGTTIMRRIIFIIHSFGTLTQIFMFTLTCNDLIRESEAISEAAFRARWYCELSTEKNRGLCKDLMFVMMRAKRPCCLTAGGFFQVSLATFTTIMSTSMSYLTLLRQGTK